MGKSKVRDDGYYYDIEIDLNKYPDAIIHIIFGGRNTGKTYGALRRAKENKIQFVFVKRSVADIDLMCSGDSKKARELGIDANLSPFVSLNRDLGWNVKPFKLNKYIGIFVDCDTSGKPLPNTEPLGYIVSLSVVSKLKGFDLSFCKWIIFDEFCPKVFDAVRANESDAILELYKTVSRDREHRGEPPLKYLFLANADNASSPTTEAFNVTDLVVEMAMKKEADIYLPDRLIHLRRLIDNKSFKAKEAESCIYRATAGTNWAKMALDNDFGYNDFSQINRINLKFSHPFASFLYKNTRYYIYIKEESGIYLITSRKYNAKNKPDYDLTLRSAQKTFFIDIVIPIYQAALEERAEFESYSLKNLFYEYKKIFKI